MHLVAFKSNDLAGVVAELNNHLTLTLFINWQGGVAQINQRQAVCLNKNRIEM